MEAPNIDIFSPTAAALADKADGYRGLTIKGIDDKIGYERVHKAEQDLIHDRVEIRRIGKSARDEYTRINREISRREDELVDLIEPVEKALKAEKKRIDEEKENIRLEAIRKKEEAERLEREEKERLVREEQERQQAELDRQRKALEEKQREQEEREARIREAEEKIEAEKKQREREQELEQARKDAEEKSRIETEARLRREQTEAEEKRQAEAEAIALAEKEEQKKLEKKRKYQAWLEENGVTDDGTFKPIRSEDGKKVILWKKVAEYIL